MKIVASGTIVCDTFVSWLVVATVSLYVVKDLLGHSSIAVTERYAHLCAARGAVGGAALLPVAKC